MSFGSKWNRISDSLSILSLNSMRRRKSVSDTLKSFSDVASTTSGDPLKRKQNYYPFGSKPVLVHEWGFGYDGNKPFLNVTTEFGNLVVLISANMLILYDYEYKTMVELFGHNNDIQYLALDCSGRWMATLDYSPNNRIVIWDITQGAPVKTIFVNSGKAENLVLSPRGKYLTMTFNMLPQILNFFVWASQRQILPAKVDFDKSIKSILQVHFSKRCDEYFVVTTKYHIIFLTYNVAQHKLEYHNPKSPADDMVKEPLEFTCSVYHDRLNVCYSATSKGGIVLWGDDVAMEKLLHKDEDGDLYEDSITNKLNGKIYLEITEYKILSMTFSEGFIIFLDEKNVIRFYDSYLAPICKFEEFIEDGIQDFQMNLIPRQTENIVECPSVNSTFLRKSTFLRSLVNKEAKEDVAEWSNIGDVHGNKKKRELLEVRDFIVQTKNNKLAYLNPITKKIYYIFTDSLHDATIMDTNPVWDYICIGSSSGYLYLYDFITKVRIVEQKLIPKNDQNAGVTSLKYSPNGHMLACGMSDGTLYFLHPLILKEVSDKIWNQSRAAIYLIQFCNQSSYMAIVDRDMIMSLFAVARKFTFIGWFRGHYEPITDLIFSNWNGSTKLFSIGEDGYLNEYDVQQCFTKKSLYINRRVRIALEALPLAMVTSPTCSNLLIICMSNFQIIKFDMHTASIYDISKAPSLLYPVHKILDLDSGHYSGNKYYIFASGCKIGIIKGPIDGNPFKWMTLRTGGSTITALSSSRDGLYGFTITHKQQHVHMWSITARNLDFLELIGGTGLVPYYSLFKRGRSNILINLLQDIFCLALLQHRGLYNLEELKLNENREVSLCEVPSILRAMGVFPSNDIMEGILNMQSFKESLISEKKVSFENIAILFFNMQVENDFCIHKIEEAFYTICSLKGGFSKTNRPFIIRDDFIKCLEEEGEKFTHLETFNFLRLLSGHKEGDNYIYNGYHDTTDYNFIPPKITLKYFLETLMGCQVEASELEKEDSFDDSEANSGDPIFVRILEKSD